MSAETFITITVIELLALATLLEWLSWRENSNLMRTVARSLLMALIVGGWTVTAVCAIAIALSRL